MSMKVCLQGWGFGVVFDFLKNHDKKGVMAWGDNGCRSLVGWH